VKTFRFRQWGISKVIKLFTDLMWGILCGRELEWDQFCKLLKVIYV